VIVTAILLLVFGLVTSMLGTQFFKILFPVIGLVAGFMVGFSGTQGLFGVGTLSNAMAVVVAIIVGVVLALLSFVLYDFAVSVIAAIVGATALSYLGVALGLRQEGFIVFVLALTGGIIGFIAAQRYAIGFNLIVALTSLFGVACVMAGIMLVAGSVSLDQLNNQGIVGTVLDVVDQSFLWFFVWVGGSILAMQVQYRIALIDALTTMFAYEEMSAPKSSK
jgi:hypothetical protein